MDCLIDGAPAPEVRGGVLVELVEFLLGGQLRLDVAGVDGVAHRPDHQLPKAITLTPTTIQASTVGNCVSQNMPYAMPAAAGMVRTHAVTISPTTFQLAPLPEETPAPITELAAAWVVEIGAPIAVAPKIAVVAPRLRRAGLACSVVMRRPIVSMIFQPPHRVPRAIAVYAAISTHSGTEMFEPSAEVCVAGAHEQGPDHTDRFLGVVCAVSERQPAAETSCSPLKVGWLS